MSQVNDEELRLYDYLIENFPLDCNTHNALMHTPGSTLKPTAEDIAIFILERLRKKVAKIDRRELP